MAPARRAVMFQILLRFEGLDLRLAVAHELQRHRLHTAGAETPPDLVPEQGAEFVPHKPVQHSAGLLGVHHPLVDLDRLIERREHGGPGDLVEHQAADLPLLRAELIGQMPADRLPFSVGVCSDVDVTDVLRGNAERLDDLLASRDRLVLRFEARVNGDTKLALGQVSDVPH